MPNHNRSHDRAASGKWHTTELRRESGPMSALGYKQTFRTAIAMSALPPKADMCSATRDVRFGPKADIRTLFDQLVSANDQPRRNGVVH
jgi:hypothetical protein